MATEYTPNYNLDLYASTDKPNLRDQYNAAMGKIDTQMKANADGLTNANANVGTLQTQMTAANENISALESTAETHGVQITQAQKKADDALTLAQTNETDIADTQADVTALSGKVDKAASDVAAVEQSVTALSGKVDEAASDVTALSGKVDANTSGIDDANSSITDIRGVVSTNTQGIAALNTKVDAIQRDMQVKSNIVVIIGDSYSVDSGTWVQTFKSANPNLEVYNYANGSCGLVRDGDKENFLKQAKRAVSELTSKAGRVSKVIVYGGVNDYRFSENTSTCTNNLKSLLTTLNKAFTNAQIHVFPMNWGKKPFDGWNYLDAWISACEGVPNCAVHDNVRFWAFGAYADDLHPNAQGYARIARLIASGINGGSTDVEFKCIVTNANTANFTPMSVFFKNGCFHVLNGNCKMPTSGGGSSPWVDVLVGNISPAPLRDIAITISASASPNGLYAFMRTDGTIKVSQNTNISGSGVNVTFAAAGSTVVPMDSVCSVM